MAIYGAASLRKSWGRVMIASGKLGLAGMAMSLAALFLIGFEMMLGRIWPSSTPTRLAVLLLLFGLGASTAGVLRHGAPVHVVACAVGLPLGLLIGWLAYSVGDQ